MKTIGVWSYKGGAGKSTIALNTAAALHSVRKRAAVLDFDPQTSLYDLARHGKLRYAVYKRERDVDAVDYLICDYPPAIDGASMSGRHDLLLIPCRPSYLDVHSLQKGLETLPDDQHSAIVLNAYDRRATEHAAILDELHAFGRKILIVPQRVAYQRAINDLQDTFAYDPHNSSILQPFLTIASYIIKEI